MNAYNLLKIFFQTIWICCDLRVKTLDRRKIISRNLRTWNEEWLPLTKVIKFSYVFSKNCKAFPQVKYLNYRPGIVDLFKILKRICNVAYKLILLEGSQVHPVFHVSHLRKWLYDQDQVIDFGILVDYEEPQVLPHEPKKVLDTHDLRTRHHVWRQVLVKWKDRPY